jgi:hypothetical protein
MGLWGPNDGKKCAKVKTTPECCSLPFHCCSMLWPFPLLADRLPLSSASCHSGLSPSLGSHHSGGSSSVSKACKSVSISESMSVGGCCPDSSAVVTASVEEMTPPAEILVPAPSDKGTLICWLFEPAMDCLTISDHRQLARGCGLGDYWRLPNLRVWQNPETLWPTLAPILWALVQARQTFLSSCMAMAEVSVNDIAGDMRGSIR